MKPTLGPGCEIDVGRLIETRMLLQANSGGGKSWAIRRLLEQIYGKVQWILIDVDGEFHTLREKFDCVLAGQRGDCPADIKSAALLGRRLLELGVSAIVDIYELGTQKKLFVKRFLDSIVQAPRELWHPVVIVIDEAHMFAPEAGQSESLSAVVDLMTLGRKRGFCGVLATQRISKLHKDAAAEANNKLVGRSSLDIDMKRAAYELGFTSREDTQSLRTLEAGEFYAYGPAFSVTGVQKIKVGSVKTTHLRAGERAAPPTPPRERVKKVLAQLADLPHEAEEEARSMADAKAKIKKLEADLRAAAHKTETKIVEKTVIKPADLKRIDKIITRGEKICRSFQTLGETFQKFGREAMEFSKDLANDTIGLRKALGAATSEPKFELPKLKIPPPRDRIEMVSPSSRLGLPTNGVHKPRAVASDSTLSKGENVVLAALIQYPDGVADAQLGVLVGYKATSRYEFMRSLKAKGLAETRNNKFYVTAAGLAIMPDVEPLPKGDALQEWWRNKLRGGELQLFEQHLAAYPETVDSPTLEEATGYKATSVYEFRRQLLARELIVTEGSGRTKASDVLFD